MSRSKGKNKGCPEVSEAVMMKLNEYSRTICLILEKHLSKETYPTLVSIKSKRISLFKILVEGHTDSDGSNEMNQLYLKTELHVKINYLIENGIKADRLNSTGLVKLNQWTLTKLLQEKHTTEELKFL
jgi:hypothetical protein